MSRINEQRQICRERYEEEQWVDFLLGNLTHMKRQQLEQHLADCPACRQHVEQWGELLTERGEVMWSSGRQQSNFTAFSDNEPTATDDAANGLPEKHLLSLRRHVKQQARWYKLKKKVSEHKYMSGIAAAAVLLLMLPFMPLKPSSQTPGHVEQYVKHYEPAAVSFVHAIDSARYRVEAAEGQRSSGYIWLKDDLSKAFLWLENLPQIGLNDYQAWAISGEQISSLGIIQLAGSEGHLYMNAPLLNPSDFITLTVEPKGGSLMPTSEQIVLIVKQR